VVASFASGVAASGTPLAIRLATGEPICNQSAERMIIAERARSLKRHFIDVRRQVSNDDLVKSAFIAPVAGFAGAACTASTMLKAPRCSRGPFVLWSCIDDENDRGLRNLAWIYPLLLLLQRLIAAARFRQA